MLAAASADTLRAVGLALAVPGACLSAGLLVFAGTVHRGARCEVLALVRLAQWCAVVASIGAAVEIWGVARLYGDGWVDALTDRAPAALLRLVGAALVVLGLFEPPETRLLGDGGEQRWTPGGAGVFAVAGAAAALVSFGFDGHTLSRGPRVVHALVDVVHVVAGSVWAGGVVGLLTVWIARRASGPPLTPLVHGFGRVATVSLAGVAAAGVVMTLLIVDSPSDAVSSPWGRRLLIKLAAVALAAGLGAHHHFRTPAGGRLGRTLAVEAAALTGVLVVTTLLVRASPN